MNAKISDWANVIADGLNREVLLHLTNKLEEGAGSGMDNMSVREHETIAALTSSLRELMRWQSVDNGGAYNRDNKLRQR